MELLNVKDLTLSFCENGNREQVVNHVSFAVQQGEILGIVGESGSGKSMVVHCVMGLHKRNQVIDSGSITFGGKELLSMTPEEVRMVQGQDMSIVFQEPMTSLNPVMKIGPQVEESLYIHHKEMSAAQRKALAIQAMKDVELPNAEELYHCYPHELSGGMRQRVMIASAIICSPRLLIADEATTALDVTIQARWICSFLQWKKQQNHGGVLSLSALFWPQPDKDINDNRRKAMQRKRRYKWKRCFISAKLLLIFIFICYYNRENKNIR